MAQSGVNEFTQGRRGYYLYEYGTHLWFPQTFSDFTAGIFRDVARADIPANGVYDSVDFMLHVPGKAFKRGGTAYAGPAMGSATYAQACAYVQFPGFNTTLTTIGGGGTLTSASTSVPFVPQLLAVGDDNHLYQTGLANSGTSDMGAMSIGAILDKPKLYVSGTQNVLIITSASNHKVVGYSGTSRGPFTIWDGQTATQDLVLTGTPTGGTFEIQVQREDTGNGAAFTTGTIAFSASAATVASALNSAPGSPGGYNASGGPLPGTTVTVTRPLVDLGTYGGTGGAQGYLTMSGTANALTGGSSPTYNFGSDLRTTTAPLAVYSEVYLSRLLLANAKANPNRLWFGPIPTLVGNGNTWDTTDSWLDFKHTVTGLWAGAGKLIVFHLGGFSTVVGDTPPPGTNMTVNHNVASIGCSDARSITTYQGQCVFANPKGVFVTTGLEPTPLMLGTIQSYWQSLFSGYDPFTWTISTGLYLGRFLWVTVLDASRNLVTTLMCDMAKRSWVRHSNIKAMMYASAYGASDELYAAIASTPRMVSLSGCYTPTSSNKNDADGTAVAPVLETRPFGGGPGVSSFGKGHVSLDMRDAASDNPTMAVQVAEGIEAPTYSAVSQSPLAEDTDNTRRLYSTGKRGQALSVKFTQANASSKTEIYYVEQDVRGFPREAGGQ